MQRSLVALVGMMAVACGQGATMTVPEVESPVMLGPVQRVGGARAGRGRLVGTVDGEAYDFVAVSQSQKNIGGGMVERTTTTTVAASTAPVVASSIRMHVDGHADRDTRIDEVNAGAWAYISIGAAGQHRWVGVKGRVVEVANGN